MSSCDVLIIGAGIAGASLAYELAPFASVLLLEREPEPGRHATGRAPALFAPGHRNRVVAALAHASRPFLETGANGLAGQPLLAPRAALLIARADQLGRLEAHPASSARHTRAVRIDGAASLARVPALRPGYVAGALYDPEVYELDAAALHRAYVEGFRARGGQLATGAEVTEMSGDGPPWQVATAAGPFEAAVVVDAAGAWADRVAQQLGAPPLGLISERRTAFLFQPTSEIDPGWPLVIDVDDEFSFRPRAGLLLGTCTDHAPAPAGDATVDQRQIARGIERVEGASRLRLHRIVQSWAGLCTCSADRCPVVGMEETMPGFFWFAALGSWGIQSTPALARAAGQLLVDGVLPDDLLALGLTAEDLMPARLRPIAYRPVNVGGV